MFLIPPEITAMLARAALLPAGITRIINGFAHLPFDLMRAIAVLDVPVETGGNEGDGVQRTYSIVICSVQPDKPGEERNRDIIERGDLAYDNLTKISDETTYLKVSETEEVTAEDINSAIANYKAKMDKDDVLMVVFSGHGERDKDPSGEDDEDEDGYIQLQGKNANEYEFYYDDQYVEALEGIKGSVVTVALSCFSGGFTDDLERANITGIHISTTDNKTISAELFTPTFFSALGNGSSVKDAFNAGFKENNESYGNEAFWNQTVDKDKEGWYHKNETVKENGKEKVVRKEIVEPPENGTETVREYYLRRWPYLDPDTVGPVVPILRPVGGVKDITFTPRGGSTEPPKAGSDAVAPAAMEEGPRIPW